MAKNIKIVELLGTAYKENYEGPFLSHACKLDEDGHYVKLLCKRAKVESICDGYECPDLEPTCEYCKKKLGAMK